MIDLTYSNGKKEATGSEHVKLVGLKVGGTIVDRIVQRSSYVVPYVYGFIPRQPSVSKSDLITEK